MEKDKHISPEQMKLQRLVYSSGGGPFGAVIVKDDKIISEAFNRVVLNNDPTAHAEILAIQTSCFSI